MPYHLKTKSDRSNLKIGKFYHLPKVGSFKYELFLGKFNTALPPSQIFFESTSVLTNIITDPGKINIFFCTPWESPVGKNVFPLNTSFFILQNIAVFYSLKSYCFVTLGFLCKKARI